MDKFVLIDGNSLINRAFYATPLLTNSDGVFTNAVYGFVNMLIKIIENDKPTHMLVAFDRKAPTFRHQIYPDYKAGRKRMPDELYVQLAVLKEVLGALNVAMFEMDGIEADDIVGTLAKKFEDVETLIYSGDKDELQLVDKNISVCLTKTGISNLDCVNIGNFESKYGYLPNQVIEFKALCGDASDNIPGVSKIGEKTALSLLQKYGYLENIYENIDEIAGKLKENLVAEKEIAFLSRELATIKCDCEIPLQIKDMQLNFPFADAAKPVFVKYQFNKLLQNRKIFQNIQASEIRQESSIRQCEVCNTFVGSVEELINILRQNADCKQFAFNFEGKISFAFNEKEQYSIRSGATLFDIAANGLSEEEFIKATAHIFEDAKIEKIIFDCKAARHLFSKYSVNLQNYQDLMLKSHIATGATKQTAQNMLEQAGFDENAGIAAYFLANIILHEKLQKQNQVELYQNIELNLSKVLFEMEKTGFAIDRAYLEKLNLEFSQKLTELSGKIYEFAGETFNINSPKQLAFILFEKLKLAGGKKTKSGFSTDIEVLENLSGFHPIIEKIIEYRTISKLNSTYVCGLLLQLDENNKVHTVFNQALTQTGRLSSKEPNLQNIPIREEVGKQLRNAFIPSLDALISADYSQIELRLLAHFSEDEGLLLAFRNNVDIHLITASQVFGVKESEVTQEMRRAAKAVNFGIIYGISDFGLSKQLNISVKKAKEYIENYFLAYPKVLEYMQYCKEFARKNGFVETLFHRRRFLPEIHSSNFNIRSFAERAAMNMPMQGTSADIIKIAMNKVAKALCGKKSKLILQVHDELVVDTSVEEIEFVKNTLAECMQTAVNLKVPLVVNVSL